MRRQRRTKESERREEEEEERMSKIFLFPVMCKSWAVGVKGVFDLNSARSASGATVMSGAFAERL